MDGPSASHPSANDDAHINSSPSAESAPPAPAEPASGPVTTMSGALQGSDVASAEKPSVEPTGKCLCLTQINRFSWPRTHYLDTEEAVNGTTEAAAKPLTDEKIPEASTAEPPLPSAEDAEMKDASAPVPASDDAVPEANGTPATSSKKRTNGMRKSGGVPEHKSKKLNKKKSQQKLTQLDAQPGQYYFARLKSYPPWPSIICDEEMLPQTLLSTRPVTTKQADGTYREAYADGGKRAHERTFPIMFLQTNEL